MDLIQCRVDAIARSIHIHTTEEAEGLVVAVAHLYRDGQLTWKALIAACASSTADTTSTARPPRPTCCARPAASCDWPRLPSPAADHPSHRPPE